MEDTQDFQSSQDHLIASVSYLWNHYVLGALPLQHQFPVPYPCGYLYSSTFIYLCIMSVIVCSELPSHLVRHSVNFLPHSFQSLTFCLPAVHFISLWQAVFLLDCLDEKQLLLFSKRSLAIHKTKAAIQYHHGAHTDI